MGQLINVNDITDTEWDYPFLVFTWRHGGHVGVQNNNEKNLLGIRFYYYEKLERHYAIVLYTNMAAKINPEIFLREIDHIGILSIGLELACNEG